MKVNWLGSSTFLPSDISCPTCKTPLDSLYSLPCAGIVICIEQVNTPFVICEVEMILRITYSDGELASSDRLIVLGDGV